jgi:uncharacterized cupredoxin-like copper-binding protein
MQRYLVAINYDGPHDRLAAEIRALALGDDAQFQLVVPGITRGKGAQTEGRERAVGQQLLDAVKSALSGVSLVDGVVGDANLFTAIDDELDRRPYDVLVIGTPPIGEHEQAHLVDRLVRLYGLPVLCVSVPGSEWLRHHPLQFALGLDAGTRRRGRVTLAGGRRRKSRRVLGLLAVACGVLLATTVGAIAWGSSQSGATAVPFPSVIATESDFTINLSASHVAAGPFALVATNHGPSAHELVVFRTTLALNKLPLGADGNVVEGSQELVKVADSGTNIAPGRSRTLYTVLTPGTYVFICNLPGHYRLGMHAALVVQ